MLLGVASKSSIFCSSCSHENGFWAPCQLTNRHPCRYERIEPSFTCCQKQIWRYLQSPTWALQNQSGMWTSHTDTDMGSCRKFHDLSMLVSSSQPLEIIIKFARNFFFFSWRDFLGFRKFFKKSGGNSQNPEIRKNHTLDRVWIQLNIAQVDEVVENKYLSQAHKHFYLTAAAIKLTVYYDPESSTVQQDRVHT